MARYFKRRWAESRGDALDHWGESTWWFETTDDGTVVRQIEQYDSGQVQRYDGEQPQDGFGGLSQIRLDLVEFQPFEILEAEFVVAWSATGGATDT